MNIDPRLKRCRMEAGPYGDGNRPSLGRCTVRVGLSLAILMFRAPDRFAIVRNRSRIAWTTRR